MALLAASMRPCCHPPIHPLSQKPHPNQRQRTCAAGLPLTLLWSLSPLLKGEGRRPRTAAGDPARTAGPTADWVAAWESASADAATAAGSMRRGEALPSDGLLGAAGEGARLLLPFCGDLVRMTGSASASCGGGAACSAMPEAAGCKVGGTARGLPSSSWRAKRRQASTAIAEAYTAAAGAEG